MISTSFAVAALAAIAAGGVAYVFLYPLLSGDARAEKRHKALVATPERRLERTAAGNRRDQVAQSLKELEAREKARHKITLEARIAQAGLTWSKGRFYAFSLAAGLGLGFLLLLVSQNSLVAAAGVFIGFLGLPRWVLSFLKKRRIKRFIGELPNALDVVVRGIRAGLPLGDCLRIIAAEAKEPLRTEFRNVVEAQTLGIPMGDAVAKIYERIPVPEANFFAIVISIQQKAGGNLSEALANLSRVLRDRKKMAGKIQAMSMEAKASASIIASLPFLVALITYVTSPSYIELLWKTNIGCFALTGSALWMTTGVAVMKKMINFDI